MHREPPLLRSRHPPIEPGAQVFDDVEGALAVHALEGVAPLVTQPFYAKVDRAQTMSRDIVLATVDDEVWPPVAATLSSGVCAVTCARMGMRAVCDALRRLRIAKLNIAPGYTHEVRA